MALLFTSLAFGAHVTALILAVPAIVCLMYNLRLKRELSVAAFSAFILHLAFVSIGNL